MASYLQRTTPEMFVNGMESIWMVELTRRGTLGHILAASAIPGLADVAQASSIAGDPMTPQAKTGPSLFTVRVAASSQIELAGMQLIDGIALGEGDHVLVRAQEDSRQNGVYVSSADRWRRSVDFGTSGEPLGRAYVVALEGRQAGAFALNSPSTTIVDRDPQSWAPIYGASADQIATQLHGTSGKLSSYLAELPLYAGNFGIKGDGQTDDTETAQKFIDLCSKLGRVAHFGSLRVKITGPLKIAGTGLVFDTNSYGAPEPGFYPNGSGYTAVHVSGTISTFRCAVIGSGELQISARGDVTADERTAVHGFLFGNDLAKGTLLISNIDYARAYNLNGRGIQIQNTWDSLFNNLVVERCGNEDDYAFSIVDGDGSTNESTFNRIQVEISVYSSISISANTLSCTYNKIHSERAVGKKDVWTWRLGGTGVYNSVRLQCHNAFGSALIHGDNLVLTSFRAEGELITSCDASGGTMTFIEAAATMTPVLNQNGLIQLIGGNVRATNIGGGWTFYGTRLSLLEVGYNDSPKRLLADHCVITEFKSVRGQKNACATLRKCTVANGSFLAKETVLEGGTSLHLRNGAATAAYAVVIVDGSTVVGNVRVETALLVLRNGSVIDGDLAILSNPQSLCDESSYVTGTVSGWTYPTATQYLVHHRGMYCKNLAPEPGESPGWTCTSVTDRRLAGTWNAHAPLAR